MKIKIICIFFPSVYRKCICRTFRHGPHPFDISTPCEEHKQRSHHKLQKKHLVPGEEPPHHFTQTPSQRGCWNTHYLRPHVNMFVFQQSVSDVEVIDEVVEITVGNEIVTGLTNPIAIDFYHDVIHVSLRVISIFVLNLPLQAVGHFDRLQFTPVATWWQ